MAKALPVLQLTENSFQIKTENFKSVLSKVGNRPFAVISINGTTRTGKSYILSHFVRYFESKKREPDCKKWYDNASCENFEWKSGIDRTTAGINLWSEPYIVKTIRGEEIAVLLIDTQGLFDHQSSIRHNVINFSISTLCSSVMIFNIMRTIDEKILQELDFFAGYAHMTSVYQNEAEAEKESRSTNRALSSYKHGSHLQFLIRDFELPEQYGYGVHSKTSNPPDKKNLFRDTISLQQRFGVANENKIVRENILRSFRDVSIYCLPDPGKEFRTQRGKQVNPDANFRDEVIAFVEYMVEGRNLVKKTVLDKPVSGLEFQQYIDNWSRLFEDTGELFPEVLAVVNNTTCTQYSIAMNLGVSNYKNKMDNYVRDKLGSATPEELEATHTKLKKEAISIFSNAQKVYHPKFEDSFRNELETELDHCYERSNVLNTMLKEIVAKSEKMKTLQKERLLTMNKRMAEERVKVQGLLRGLKEINENLQSSNELISKEIVEYGSEVQVVMDEQLKTIDQLHKTSRDMNRNIGVSALQLEKIQTLTKKA